MTVTEMKHTAKRQEWQEKIMECRSSGMSVKQWCEGQGVTTTTYYRWEREIFGRLEKKGKETQALAVSRPEFVEAPVVKPCGLPGQTIMRLRMGAMEVDIYAGTGISEIEAICRALKYAE